MAMTEPRSLIGCSAGIAADAALSLTREEWAQLKRKRRRRALTPAQPADRVPRNLCPKCGMLNGSGAHKTADECIAALRDRLARFE
jgi:hypothetical protein